MTVQPKTNHVTKENDAAIRRLAITGLMAALCYIGFAFFKIDVPIPGDAGKTAFHFGNAFCVLGALLLGGPLGGLSGAVGMTIADLTSGYATSAPTTFVLKFMIGMIVGLIAHKIFHLSKSHNLRFITIVTVFSSACGMIFNFFADPIIGYLYKSYILGTPQDIASVYAKWEAGTTLANAIIAVIAASVIYLALRPALTKTGLLPHVGREETL